jgi:hypothetical protein
MRKTSFKSLFVFALLAIIFGSCRKMDLFINPTKTDFTNNTALVEKFLKVPSNAGVELRSIISDLRKSEFQHPFLAKIIVQNGMPEWSYTISSNPLLNNGNTIRVSSEQSTNSTQGHIYFIPLLDSITHEVKSFLYCERKGDSSFRYQLYNKQYILNESLKSKYAVQNGRLLLSVFATFENRINHKSTMVVNAPYAITFQNSNITFLDEALNMQAKSMSISNLKDSKIKPEGNSTVSTQLNINKNIYVPTTSEIKANAECPWILRTQTVQFTLIAGSESQAYEWAWKENICTHEIQFIGIFPINGTNGSNNGGGGSYSGNGNSGGNDPGNGGWGNWNGSQFYPGGPNPIGDPGSVNNPPFIPPSPYSPRVLAIALYLPQLTDDQKLFLTNNPTYTDEFLEAIINQEVLTEDDIAASMISIELIRRGVEYTPSDAAYEDVLNTYLPNPSLVPIGPILMRYHTNVLSNAAILQLAHPEWSSLRCWWEAQKETIQTGLDVISLSPIVGSFANLANGAIYSFDGNSKLAVVSFALAIPGASYINAGEKIATKIVLTPVGKTTLKWIVQTTGKISFGSRTYQLRKVLGLAAGDARQAHHIIPWELAENEVVQAASKIPGVDAFHMNDLINGIALDKSVHVEGMIHLHYSNKIKAKLIDIQNNLGPNIDPLAAKQALESLINDIKTWIAQNPGVNINNIILP